MNKDLDMEWMTVEDEKHGRLNHHLVRSSHKALIDHLTPTQLDAFWQHTQAYKIVHGSGYSSSDPERVRSNPSPRSEAEEEDLRNTYHDWASILMDSSHPQHFPQAKLFCDYLAEGNTLYQITRFPSFGMSIAAARKVVQRGLDVWANKRGWTGQTPLRTNPTPKEREILDWLTEQTIEGKSPSYREIGEKFGIPSTQGVSNMLERFEAKGFIHRFVGKQRSITVLV